MHPFERDSRRWVRWWWLRGPFADAAITGQLRWLREHGFGGVLRRAPKPPGHRPRAGYDALVKELGAVTSPEGLPQW